MLSQLIFACLLIASIAWFTRNVNKIRRNIRLGRPIQRSGQKSRRWKLMARVALGQGKMVSRPIAGVLHILVYAGFIIINIEVLEILIDGLLGTHRVFGQMAPALYNALIAAFEYLALGVLLACLVFLIRRNLLRLRRFSGTEMTSWPKSDANFILIAEILLMAAFLTMNGADYVLQLMGTEHYVRAGAYPVSAHLMLLLPGDTGALIGLERFCWWFHILGILAFLNYIPYSKHFHIFLAFPNTWYAKLEAKGRFPNMAAVTDEVKAALDPSHTPVSEAPPEHFGARDVGDLHRMNLMNAYACTECGRCTSVCPANLTGKLLSPRKIMMDTRDRLEELGKAIDRQAAANRTGGRQAAGQQTTGGEATNQEVAGQESTGKESKTADGKTLLGDYISKEELWACTTCNACVEACPVLIDPLDIILQLRQSLIMEESQAPQSWNVLFNNIENNGAPWQFAPDDRLNWAKN